MADRVKLKRSAVQGKVPLTTDLELGELAVNTYDGKIYLKKDDGSESIVEIGAGGGSGISNVVEDTTPQLGGNLDYNNFGIVDSTGDSVLAFSSNLSSDSYITIQSGSDSSSNIYAAPQINSSGVSGDMCVMLGSQAKMFYVDGNIGIHADSSIMDSSRCELIKFTGAGNAVNHIGIGNADTGWSPSIQAVGDDTNINLNLAAKGDGNVNFQSPVNFGSTAIVCNTAQFQTGSTSFFNFDGDFVVRDTDDSATNFALRAGSTGDGITTNGVSQLSIRNKDNGQRLNIGYQTGDSGVEVEKVYINNPQNLPFHINGFVLTNTDGTNGQVLTTDGAGNLTFQDAPSGGASALDDLTDVVITNAQTDEILKFNGTNWVNAVNTGGSGIANVVEDTSPQLGGALDLRQYNLFSSVDGEVAVTGNLHVRNTDTNDTKILVQASQSTNETGLYGVSWSGIEAFALKYDGNTNSVSLTKNPSVTHFYIDEWRLPASDGADGQVLVTDGAGNLSFQTLGGIDNLVEDTTPQLGGHLDVNGNDIVSVSNGNIAITPNGTGSIVLDGLNWPQADGTADQVLKTNGSGQLGWATVSGAGTPSQVSVPVTQASHGFTTGDAIYYNGTAWAKAQANNVDTIATNIAVVTDSDNFNAVLMGTITTSGLTAGSWYYCSAATAGALTTTEPGTGNYSNPVGQALSTTTLMVMPYRASEVA